MDVCICGDGYGLSLSCPRHGQHLRKLSESNEDPVDLITKQVADVEYGGTLDERQVNILRNGIRIGLSLSRAVKGVVLLNRLALEHTHSFPTLGPDPARAGMGDAHG